MLRLLLGTAFLLSSSVPALAQWSCSYCRGTSSESFRAYPTSGFNPSETLHVASGLDSMMAFSVIYPGVIVLMTMMAWYFMRVMEPQAHAHPGFIRSTLTLSGLWVAGFYPFLASATGGFLFCVTAISCTGAWVLISRFNIVKYWERWLVFWAFFFFSLMIGIIAAGNGADISGGFEKAWQDSIGSFRVVGPIQWVLANIVAVLTLCLVSGWKPKPLEAEGKRQLKIWFVIAAAIGMNMLALGTQFKFLSSVAAVLMMCAPSLAYYGAYLLVMRLPPEIRGRAGAGLFVLLAAFIGIMTGLAVSAPAATMLVVGLGVSFIAVTGKGVGLLWQSDASRGTKKFLSAVAFAVTLGMASIAFITSWLSPLVKLFFVCDRLVPLLLGWHSLLFMLAAVLVSTRFILSRNNAPRDKYTVAAIVLLFELLGLACMAWASPLAN